MVHAGMFCNEIGPSGPAARSRARAEGCSLTSQAHRSAAGRIGTPIDLKRHLGGKFEFGTQPAECAHEADLRDAKLRASATPRLRPTNRCAIDLVQKARSRADGLAFELREEAALRQGAAAGCPTSPTSNLPAGISSTTGSGCGPPIASQSNYKRNYCQRAKLRAVASPETSERTQTTR